MSIYTDCIRTRPHQAGRDFQVRLQHICNFCEDAAGSHADALGCGLQHLQAYDLAWVLSKMQIKQHAPVWVGDDLHVSTWPAGVERLQYRRDFTITTTYKEALFSIVTWWVLINIHTRKVEKMPPALAFLYDKPEHSLDCETIRLPVVGQGEAGPEFTIRLADIDQNNHVNNVRYIDFAQEAAAYYATKHTWANPNFSSITLQFRAESVHGDTITSSTCPHPALPNALVHSLCRKSTGQELTRVVTVHE